MQEHDRAERAAIRLQDKGPVPVLPEMAGVDRASFEIPVQRNAIPRSQPTCNLVPDSLENAVLGIDVFGPVRPIDRTGAQLMRHKGVPGFERGPPLRIPRAQADESRKDRREGDQDELQTAPHARNHAAGSCR